MPIYYDDEYCCNLIKAALTDTDKKYKIKVSKIKKLIMIKVRGLKDDYGLHHSEIYSDITFNFLAKSKIIKIDTEKGTPTTFILQYVFNQLRNIERKCQRGTYHENSSRKEDVMKLMDEGIYSLFDEDSSFMDMILDGMNYDDPETLLLRKEVLNLAKKYFTLDELIKLSEENIEEELKAKIIKFKELYDL